MTSPVKRADALVKWNLRAKGFSLCSISQGLHLAHKKLEDAYGFIPYLLINKISSKSRVYLSNDACFRHHFALFGDSYQHAVSANRILWVYAGFWWYHGILVVHLQDSVGAFWAIKDQDASIRGPSVENVMTDGLSRVCIWWCIMLSLITKITGIYFVGEKC